MKKIIKVVFFMTLFITLSININAKDIGQNISGGKVISSYDDNTKELFVYGENKNGNLGNKTYTNVSEGNKIRVNDLIGNKKIVDYYLDENVSYLLADDNNLYTAGIGSADSLNGGKNTFKKIVLYKNSQIKKTSIEGNISRHNKGKYRYSINVNTSSKGISYYYDYKNYINDTVNCFASTTNGNAIITTNASKVDINTKMTYIEKTKKYEYNIRLQNNGKYAYRSKEYTNGSDYYWHYYSTGKVSTYDVDIPNKYGYTSKHYIFHKNGKLKQSQIDKDDSKGNYYSLNNYDAKGKLKFRQTERLGLDKKKEYYRNGTKKYYYTSGKLKERKVYKVTNKHKYNIHSKSGTYLVTKKEYKQNKKGKKYYYVTHYKKGKATKTYYYELNKKNKVVNKKVVKTRKLE